MVKCKRQAVKKVCRRDFFSGKRWVSKKGIPLMEGTGCEKCEVRKENIGNSEVCVACLRVKKHRTSGYWVNIKEHIGEKNEVKSPFDIWYDQWRSGISMCSNREVAIAAWNAALEHVRKMRHSHE